MTAQIAMVIISINLCCLHMFDSWVCHLSKVVANANFGQKLHYVRRRRLFFLAEHLFEHTTSSWYKFRCVSPGIETRESSVKPTISTNRKSNHVYEIQVSYRSIHAEENWFICDHDDRNRSEFHELASSSPASPDCTS